MFESKIFQCLGSIASLVTNRLSSLERTVLSPDTIYRLIQHNFIEATYEYRSVCVTQSTQTANEDNKHRHGNTIGTINVAISAISSLNDNIQ